MEGWVSTLERWNGVLVRVAGEEGLRLADVRSAVGGKPEYFEDFVHVTPEGHEIVARVLAEALAGAAPGHGPKDPKAPKDPNGPKGPQGR